MVKRLQDFLPDDIDELNQYIMGLLEPSDMVYVRKYADKLRDYECENPYNYTITEDNEVVFHDTEKIALLLSDAIVACIFERLYFEDDAIAEEDFDFFHNNPDRVLNGLKFYELIVGKPLVLYLSEKVSAQLVADNEIIDATKNILENKE